MSNNGSPLTWTETEAGQRLQAHLSEERTLAAIDRLLDRLDTVEQAVERLSTMMQQGPGMTAMFADMADEAYRKADANGISIDQRLKNALAIAEKLTSPEMTQKLDHLITFTNQAPGLMAMTADMADSIYRQADTNGISIDQRLKNALEIAEKLTSPEMTEKLGDLLSLADQAPGLIAMTADMADEAYRKADARGVSIDQRIKLAWEAAEKLTAPEMIAKLEQLLVMGHQMPGLVAITADIADETMRNAIAKGVDPQTIAQIAGSAGQALSQARQEAPAKVGGIFSLLGALKDSDRQRGLGFLMNFLKHFGKNL